MTSAFASEPDDLTGLGVLADPLRRRLYEAVVAHEVAVGREQISAETGLVHHVVKFNLEKLVAAGLLDVEHRRLEERTGPGAGRPSKLYRRAARTFEVSLPSRRYEFAGRILAHAVQAAQVNDEPIADAVRRTAAEAGHRLGRGALNRGGRRAPSSVLIDALSAEGFEPAKVGKQIVLRNCPFAGLVADCATLICHMNLDMMNGLIDEVGAEQYTAGHEIDTDTCCVRLTRR